MQDQGVTKASRKEIAERIAYQKTELESCIDKALAIESEILELEAKLYSRGDPLNNIVTCHNQTLFAQKSCNVCWFYKRCGYRYKEDYGKFKL